MDIKWEKPVREPNVGDVYLYDAKHYLIVVDDSDFYSGVNLKTMELEYCCEWINHLEPVSHGEYVGTLKITT